MIKILSKEDQERFKRHLESIDAANRKKGAQVIGPDLLNLASRGGLIESPADESLKSLITTHKPFQDTINLCKKYATLSYPCLITGETGAGKESLAQGLHGTRQGQFRGINITTLPELLIESELFGHIKGSFTGAFEDKVGLLEFCANGTIFLDEIGDMPMGAQTKLLRVIQENKIRRIGSNEERPISCRFVFATHQCLTDLIKERRFRQDLYYRINVLNLNTVPLRERPNDIREILDHWTTTEFENEFIDEETIRLWEQLSWEGNVRELWNYAIRYHVERSLNKQ